MSKSSEKYPSTENYSSHIATALRKLLECSPKTGERTTYKALGELLGVKQQSVSLWANGETIPDTKHIVQIAEYFGVTCDYLLGMPNTNPTKEQKIQNMNDYLLGMANAKPTKEQELQNIINYTGLKLKTIELLNSIYTLEKSDRSTFYLDFVNAFLSPQNICSLFMSVKKYVDYLNGYEKDFTFSSNIYEYTKRETDFLLPTLLKEFDSEIDTDPPKKDIYIKEVLFLTIQQYFEDFIKSFTDKYDNVVT